MNATQVREATQARIAALTQHNLQAPAAPRRPGSAADVAWPWTVAQAGGAFLAGPHGGLAYDLGTLAANFAATGGGAALTSALAGNDWGSKTVSPSVASAVESSGVFGPALGQVQADQLMRSLLVGVVHGVNVAVGGEMGGSGVAIDVASTQDVGGYTYEVGEVGFALGGTFALALGAVSAIPAQLSTSVTSFSVGASLGPGVLLTVLMNGDASALLGFIAAAGVGASVTGAVGWGTSWAF